MYNIFKDRHRQYEVRLNRSFQVNREYKNDCGFDHHAILYDATQKAILHSWWFKCGDNLNGSTYLTHRDNFPFIHKRFYNYHYPP